VSAPREPRQEALDDRRSRLTDEQKELLARRLRGRKGGEAPASPATARALVPLDPAGTQRPFFCVHPAGGDVLCFAPLARHLGADQPLYGLQSPGIVADCEPFATLPEMASSYVAEIRQLQPEGPYRIGGWSLGGVVAFEMAQQLARAGQEVELLAIFDTVPRLAETQPAASEPGFWDDDARWLLEIAAYAEGLWGKSLGVTYEELAALSPDERLARCSDRLRELQLLPPGAGPAWLARVLRVFKANVRAGLGYEPTAPYPGRITLFRAADAPESAPDLGWGDWSPLPVEVHVCPGSHVTLLAEANVAVLAERLRGSL
jgi:thioesterase domain-containing protein